MPQVPTAVPIGAEQQPLKLAIIGEPTTALNRVADNLGETLSDELANFRLGYYEGIFVEVTFLENTQEALDLLCSSPDTAVFVDAFTYAAAAQQCDVQPAFQAERDGQTGRNFELAVFRQRIGNMSNLVGRAFCTMSSSGLMEFIYPALAFKVNGVDPLDDFSEIKTGFESEAEMVLAMAGRYEPGGQPACDGAPVTAGTFEDIRAELMDTEREQSLTEFQMNQVELLEIAPENQWPEVPNELLVFPPDNVFPAFLREEVVGAINDLMADQDGAIEDLQTLIEHDTLVPVTADNLAPFRDWLARAGWNLAESPLN